MRRYRWGNNYVLSRVVFLAVRDALNQPAHPDSKRQDRRRSRDLERYGARILKESRVSSCPVTRTSKRQDIKEMQARLRKEQVEISRKIADRLLGGKRAA